ncbi:hypothetical protein GF380_00855 [Candidatus Uhrbacteria bacterium]|nr:hypothetical protein [Candidatus Uhrbacteria bacterium]MBD3284663.1 hypothetical protein [Candidatus Uhrbacteria bacterium]
MIGGSWFRRRARSEGRNVRRPLLGFTVLELLVVVTIFAIGSIAISATYINFTRLHRRASNAQQLAEEMRFITELITREIRNNRIEWALINNHFRGAVELLDEQDSRIRIVFTGNDTWCDPLEVDNCIIMSHAGEFGWTPITGKRINVVLFRAFYTPYEDPFTSVGLGSYPNDQQPRITFLIHAEYVADHPRESVSMEMQTTVSSRVYVR